MENASYFAWPYITRITLSDNYISIRRDLATASTAAATATQEAAETTAVAATISIKCISHWSIICSIVQRQMTVTLT